MARDRPGAGPMIPSDDRSPPASLSRRNVLLGSVAMVGAAARSQPIAVVPPAARQPNIIWVVCHDIFAPLLGTYGNPLARTPTIDRLAREGTRFDNAFSVAPVCAPSRFALVTGLYPDSCGPAQHMRAVGHVPDDFASLPELMRAAGYHVTNNVFTDYNCDLDPARMWDDWSNTAHWRGRPPGKPFFCVYNYFSTHESQVIDFKGELRTDPTAVAVPPYLPDLPEIRTAIARNIDLVARQDASLKTLLDQLDEDGLAEETVVVFLADHGGVAPRSKRYCYEEGLRIPLIVRVPGPLAHLRAGHAPGVAADQLVSIVDVAPTTLALAGAAIPAHMAGKPFLGIGATRRRVAFSGRNRMDERYDMVRTARDARYRYIRNYAPHRIYGQHSAYEWQLAGYQAWEQAHRDGRLDAAQDRFWREKPAEELYDVRRDPHQQVNLAGDPAHRSRLTSLSRALDRHMVAIRDNGLLPEGGAGEGYRESRAGDVFPIGRVLSLARQAIDRRADDVPAFLSALDDGSESIRFWAAQGLLMAPMLPQSAVEAAQRRLCVETSPHVRCVLAETIGRRGDAAVALRAMIALLEGDATPRIKLQALDALTGMPLPVVEPARSAIARAGKTDEYTSNAANYLLLRLDGTYVPSSKTFTFQAPPSPALRKQLSEPKI